MGNLHIIKIMRASLQQSISWNHRFIGWGNLSQLVYLTPLPPLPSPLSPAPSSPLTHTLHTPHAHKVFRSVGVRWFCNCCLLLKRACIRGNFSHNQDTALVVHLLKFIDLLVRGNSWFTYPKPFHKILEQWLFTGNVMTVKFFNSYKDVTL